MSGGNLAAQYSLTKLEKESIIGRFTRTITENRRRFTRHAERLTMARASRVSNLVIHRSALFISKDHHILLGDLLTQHTHASSSYLVCLIDALIPVKQQATSSRLVGSIMSSIVTIRLHTMTGRRPPRLELSTEKTARCGWEKEASNGGDCMQLRGAVSPAQYGGSPSRLPEQATTFGIYCIRASVCTIFLLHIELI